MLEGLIDEHGKESVILLALGIAFVLASFVTPWIFGSRLAWNENLGRQYQTAAANYHASFPKRGTKLDVEFSQAKSEFERLDQQLNNVQSRGAGTATCLRWMGGLLAAIGVGLSWRRRRSRTAE
jgi:hypothetical protein